MDQEWNKKSASDCTQLSNLCFGLLQCPINLAELWGHMPIADPLSRTERTHTVAKLLTILVFPTQPTATVSGVKVGQVGCVVFKEFQIRL